MKVAYFAGGCFWCIASVYNQLDGVINVTSGFSGGKEINPTYEDVKAQKTSHRETIKISYDEKKINFEELLKLFINNVDLYDDGGQFIDRGRSYTLAIYYQDNNEKETAIRLLKEQEKLTSKKPCVSIEEFINFYSASEYHQNFNLNHPEEFEKELKESGRKK